MGSGKGKENSAPEGNENGRRGAERKTRGQPVEESDRITATAWVNNDTMYPPSAPSGDL
jgi:hypothetical protein